MQADIFKVKVQGTTSTPVSLSRTLAKHGCKTKRMKLLAEPPNNNASIEALHSDGSWREYVIVRSFPDSFLAVDKADPAARKTFYARHEQRGSAAPQDSVPSLQTWRRCESTWSDVALFVRLLCPRTAKRGRSLLCLADKLRLTQLLGTAQIDSGKEEQLLALLLNRLSYEAKHKFREVSTFLFAHVHVEVKEAVVCRILGALFIHSPGEHVSEFASRMFGVSSRISMACHRHIMHLIAVSAHRIV
eukprot:20642-Pleurochrysis_carterae.AAC.2